MESSKVGKKITVELVALQRYRPGHHTYGLLSQVPFESVWMQSLLMLKLDFSS